MRWLVAVLGLVVAVAATAIATGQRLASTPAGGTDAPAPAAAGPSLRRATSAPPARVVVRYRIERRTTDTATADFIKAVVGALEDRRGWQRAGFDFVLDPRAAYLVVLGEPEEVDRLCRPYDTAGRFSCQNGPVVALNADRWRAATRQWTGDLAAYRLMLVNHEVGHLLGLHHPQPQCPGAGLPAAVMSQQSTELGGCQPNPWPLDWEIKLAADHSHALAPGPDQVFQRPRDPRSPSAADVACKQEGSAPAGRVTLASCPTGPCSSCGSRSSA
ncbi:MAG TPA: DUF3152 domain-containing protein [Egibacteraceae bacterium]|nr:DUF3152 domain-containing protein [Egibacteraceae bacterium]